MCGIAGILSFSKSIDKLELLINRMTDKISHRGPDDSGFFVKYTNDLSIALGHRRLSIIDLETGHQPITKDNCTIVYNGEVYNFQEIKKNLEEKYIFSTKTDTEVILTNYIEKKEDFLNDLRGMFSFAIFDENKGHLVLARDRIGQKPLFYYYKNGFFAFASEIQALLELDFIEKEINYNSIFKYLHLGYIPYPETAFKNIKKLPPASFLIVSKAGIFVKKYWELSKRNNNNNFSEEYFIEQTKYLLEESVKLRMIADVPLGAFLSGGIDSSLIAILMAKQSSQPINTFSIGFKKNTYNELRYSKQVANFIGSNHNEFVVEADAISILDDLVEHFGEPFADSSAIPTYYVSKITSDYVKVALSGDGGDEAFWGYDRYKAFYLSENFNIFFKFIIMKFAKFIPDNLDIKNKLARIKRFARAMELAPLERYFKWISLFDHQVLKAIGGEHIESEHFELDFFDDKLSLDFDKINKFDYDFYLPCDILPKVDIASMANSLEVRAPLLDHKLVEFAFSIPLKYKFKKRTGKYILKKILKELMPGYDIKREKFGFGVPIADWIRNDLKDFTRELLLDGTFDKRGVLKKGVIDKLLRLHFERKANFGAFLYSLVFLELWFRKFSD